MKVLLLQCKRVDFCLARMTTLNGGPVSSWRHKSAVKINNKMTEAFPCYTGVKQGCMLSSTLFNLYLSDLPEFLNSSSSTDILLDDCERPINCLL